MVVDRLAEDNPGLVDLKGVVQEEILQLRNIFDFPFYLIDIYPQLFGDDRDSPLAGIVNGLCTSPDGGEKGSGKITVVIEFPQTDIDSSDKAEAEKERERRNKKRNWFQRAMAGRWYIHELELVEIKDEK